ncbi:unnamed protein product [Arctia plantaginis]|uniref:Uncharacterized protein n=1 Tax=Arctia plantaginis TaxID=874455 RepID=A0A8S0ZGV5_ARCPL|nr:unnamed protein product [Arctia plantaginis]
MCTPYEHGADASGPYEHGADARTALQPGAGARSSYQPGADAGGAPGQHCGAAASLPARRAAVPAPRATQALPRDLGATAALLLATHRPGATSPDSCQEIDRQQSVNGKGKGIVCTASRAR